MSDVNPKIIIDADDRTRAAFRSASKNLEDFAGGLLGVSGALAGLLGAAGIGALIKSQFELGDQLAKSSQKIGVTVEALSAYQYAAKLSGTTNEELNGGLMRLSSTMKDAIINPTGDAARMFELLGVKVTDSSGKMRDTGIIFEELSARFAMAEDGSSKTAAAIQLMGRSGANLIPLMNSLQALTEEARQTGQIVSTQFAKDSERFNDNMERMTKSVGILARSIGNQLLPAFNDITERLNVMIGAQTQLSLETMNRDRAALARQYSKLVEREQMLGFTENFVAAEKAKIRTEIDAIDALIIAENKKILALDASKAAAKASGKNIIPTIGAKPESGGGAKMGPDLTKEFSNYQLWLDEQQKKREEFDQWNTQRDMADLERLRAHLAATTELESAAIVYKQELEAEAYENRLFTVEENFASLLITEQERKLLLEDLERSHMANLAAIQLAGTSVQNQQWAAAGKARSAMWQAAWKGDLAAVGGVLGEVSALMQSQSKKQFEIGKKAAIAQSIIQTYVAVQNALATPPIFLGLAMAAVALGVGLMNVQKIRSTQFQGGGSPSGASPTYSANPSTGIPDNQGSAIPPAPSLPTASAGASRTINITLTGSGRYTADEITNLIEQINDGQADGSRVNVYQ